jgi:UDP-N-acetylmuramyl pentapeptide phosphotransferase/UDP-N-acetylglucosamine-1-phosphate transferase
MTTHAGLMVLFAVLVSTVFATLLRDHPREQLVLALRLLGAFIVVGFVLGWLMYPFPL